MLENSTLGPSGNSGIKVKLAAKNDHIRNLMNNIAMLTQKTP